MVIAARISGFMAARNARCPPMQTPIAPSLPVHDWVRAQVAYEGADVRVEGADGLSDLVLIAAIGARLVVREYRARRLQLVVKSPARRRRNLARPSWWRCARWAPCAGRPRRTRGGPDIVRPRPDGTRTFASGPVGVASSSVSSSSSMAILVPPPNVPLRKSPGARDGTQLRKRQFPWSCGRRRRA